MLGSWGLRVMRKSMTNRAITPTIVTVQSVGLAIEAVDVTGCSAVDQTAGRVEAENNGYANVRIVIPETGEIVQRVYDSRALGHVQIDSTTLLVEKCCSVCHKLNWDNKTGGYREKHINKDTGLEVLCDDAGKTYIDGDLIPPRMED
jgi:hypothetical protein